MKIGFNVTICPMNFLPTNARERRRNAVIGEGKHIWPEALRHFENAKPFCAQPPPSQFDLPDPKKYIQRNEPGGRGCRRCRFTVSKMP